MVQSFDSEEEEVSEVESLVLEPEGEGEQEEDGNDDDDEENEEDKNEVGCEDDEEEEEEEEEEELPISLDTFSDGCDLEAIRKLLEEGRNVNDMTEEGESLLSLACSSGYLELVQLLLATRTNVDDRGLKDTTPLMEAASTGNRDIVQLLLDHGADVNAQTTQGNTPLMYAASYCGPGSDDIVQLLLKHGANVSDCNENGHTPLMEAASAGNVEVARILVSAGASINTHSNEFKESALTLACYKGHLEMVRFLLEAGADQEHKTEEMHTALMEASMDGHVAVARLLLDSGAQVNMPADSFESPLTLAACGGHVELAMLLLERGANIEEVNDEGYTPLMEASREGHEEMVALLLSQGADINAQTDETQETALTLACCGGFLEVADFLIKAGADIEAGANTPLAEAAQEGHLDLVRHLIDSGANIHATSGTGDTPLMYAAENGHTDVVQTLLEAGACIEHEAEGGRTPLMKACRAGHLCTVQFLVSRGANVNKVTINNDHTPLSLACAGGHMAVVEYLLANGADSTHRLKDNSTMLIEAAKGGHAHVVQLLIEHPSRSSPTPPVLLGDTTQQAPPSGQVPSSVPPPVPSLTNSSNANPPPFTVPSNNNNNNNNNPMIGKVGGIVNPLSGDPCRNQQQQVTGSTLGQQQVSMHGSSVGQQQRMLPSSVGSLKNQQQHAVNTEQLIENAIQWSKQRKAGIKKPKLPDPNECNVLPDSNSTSVSTPIVPTTSGSVKGKTVSGLDKKSAMDGVVQLIKSLESGVVGLGSSDSSPSIPTVVPSSQYLSSITPTSQTGTGQSVPVTGTSQTGTGLSVPVTGASTNVPDQQKQKTSGTGGKVSGPSSCMEADRALKETERLEQCINSMMKRTEMLNPSREEQILQKQQILQELQRVEKELQEKAQQQLLLSQSAGSLSQSAGSVSQSAGSLSQSSGSGGGGSDVRSVDSSMVAGLAAASQIADVLARSFGDGSSSSGCSTLDSNWSLAEVAALRRRFCPDDLHPSSDPSDPSCGGKSAPAPSLLPSLAPSVPLDTLPITQFRRTTKKGKKKGCSSTSTSTSNTGIESLAESVEKMNLKNSSEVALAIASHPQQAEILNQLAVTLATNQVVKNRPSSDQQQGKSIDGPSSLKPVLEAAGIVPQSTGKDESMIGECSDGIQSSHQSTQTLPSIPVSGSNSSSFKGTITSENNSLTLTLASSGTSTGTSTSVTGGQPSTGFPPLTAQQLQLLKTQLAAAAQAAVATSGSDRIMSNLGNNFNSALVSLSASLSAATLSSPSSTSNQIQVGQQSIITDCDVEQQLALFQAQLAGTDLTEEQKSEIKEQITRMNQSGYHVKSINPEQYTNDHGSSAGGNNGAFDPNTIVPRISSSSSKLSLGTNVASQTAAVGSDGTTNLLKQLAVESVSADSTTMVGPGSLYENKTTSNVNRPQAGTISSSFSWSPDTNSSNTTSSSVPSPPPFFSHSIEIDGQTDSNHDTALTLSCAGGHDELVSLLLSRGANCEHRDKKGFTPLMLAATAGHANVCEILLNHGVDIEAQSERTKDTALSLACSSGRYEVVELLLSRQANKEHRNVSDYTPLSLAASGGYVNIIKLLLNHGAEINSRTGSKLGISPLMLAAMNGHAATVKLLLDMGSDINAQIETNRNTALTLACFQGRCEVVSLLLDRKANVEHRAKTGLTPLMEAASGGYVEVGRILLDKGADVNAPPVPSSRDTALTIAADKGHYRFVELLIKRGGQALNLDARNKKGSSPLWLAANGGHLDVVQLLVNSGADIDAQDNRKVSCLMAAFRKGHIKVVKWMVKHVTQFPSDQEMTRTLALVNDKEMLKKCNQCMEIIRLAKEKQAAEANKNATILLEELESERIRAENKKAKLASKREKKKAKKKEKKGGKGGDTGSGTTNGGSKSGKDGGKKVTKNDSSSESESDIDEEDPSSSYDDHLTSLPDPVTYHEPVPSVVLREVTITKKSVPTIQSSSQQKRPSSDQPMSPSKDSKKSKQPVQVVEVSTTTISATTLKPGKEAKPSQGRKSSVPSVTIEPVVVEPSKPASKKAEPLKNPKANVSSTTTKKVQPTTQRQSTPPGTMSSKHGSTDVPRVPTPSSPATGKGSNRQSSHVQQSSSHVQQSSSHVQQCTKYDSESEWPIGNFDSVGTWSGATSSSIGCSNEWKPVKQTAAGWKEVTRRSKKVAVPSTAISRVIGRGGCNINAVREISGAHIEVEKQKGQQSDRQILIKGTQDATRNAQLMINALVNEPEKDLNQIIASLGLTKSSTDIGSSKSSTDIGTDHYMTTDSNVFERIPSAGFNSSTPTITPSASRSKLNSSTIGSNSSSTLTSSGNKSTTSSATGTTSTMIGSNAAKDSSTKIGVFSTMSSSNSGTTSGVVRTNKPVGSATTPAFTSSLTWASKSQSPRPGIVASTSTTSSKASCGQATVTEKSTTPSPFGSGCKVTSGAQQPFAPKSPSSVHVGPGSPPSATSQYTPFNDTFGKVAGSVWGKSSSEKVNFANIVKGTLTSASGEVLNSGQNTTSQGSPGALHVHPSTSPDLNVSIADQCKAPGFRGPNYASPGVSCNQQQQQSGLNYGNLNQGHRSAPCTPPLLPAGHSVQQISPESTAQESSPQLRSTSSNAASDHFGSMYQTSAAPFSPGSSKNFSLAPGSRPQGQSSFGNQGYTTPSSSYTIMSSDRSQSPSSTMMDHGTLSNDANSGLNPNAPSYAPDSPAGQAAAHVRLLSNHLAHTSNLLRTASMQPSGQMSASGSPMHSQSQSSGQLRSFDGQGQVPNPHLQMQMRAAILAAGASLQMQAQQQQQARFQASMAAHHSAQPGMNQSIMVQQQQQQMAAAYNSITGPDFAPASAEALRLLQTALMNTTTSSIPGHYGQAGGQMVSNHTASPSSTGQGQSMGQSSSTGSSRPTAGVIGAGRKMSSQSSGLMSEASNQDGGGQGQDQSGGDSSPESKSVPRPIGTERAQKTSQLKNPYHGIPSGIIGSTNFGTTNDTLWNIDPLTSGHGTGMMSGGMISDMDWMTASQMAPPPSGPMDQSSFMSNLLASSQSYATGNSGLNRGYIDPTFGADPLLGAAMNGAAAGMIGGQSAMGLGQQTGLGGLPFGVPTGQTGNEAADYWTGKLPLGGYDASNQATNPTSNASWYNY